MTPTATLPPAAPAPLGPPPLTLEDFLTRYGDRHVEVIDGVVKETPMPKMHHGLAVTRLSRFLDEFTEGQRPGFVCSGETFVLIRKAPLHIRAADIAYWSRDKLPGGIPESGVTDIPPDLCVEVVSPSNTWNEIFTKVGEYLGIGVPVVVVLAPASRTASVYRDPADAVQQVFREADTLTLPDVLPGFAVPVRRFFE